MGKPQRSRQSLVHPWRTGIVSSSSMQSVIGMSGSLCRMFTVYEMLIPEIESQVQPYYHVTDRSLLCDSDGPPGFPPLRKQTDNEANLGERPGPTSPVNARGKGKRSYQNTDLVWCPLHSFTLKLI